ncbi:uncharacterized protein SPSC_00873 [Sporisorium scitamineum]|uniref:Uncharacterized protein n=1 Tax=Sporisorium scitamineum TaxID=49012 RepID=A0A0F7RV85_9BASI|nr:hypothetical protein [Sporisorium scitamineum]CDU22243.1 uncharacterized protein SPSC_00873 [Sporisorium scitamineum]
MARSTHTSPGPSSALPTRSKHRRAARKMVISESDCDADDSCSSEPDVAFQPSARTRLPRFASASDEDSACEVSSTVDTDANLLSEDDAYMQDLAQATQVKPDVLRQRLRAPGDNREKVLAQLLDSGKRSDLRMKKFGDFIHPSVRNTLDVPKKVSKDFFKNRAKKFVDLFDLYLSEVQRPGEPNEQLLMNTEMFLADLMDCVDHPQEMVGWNPFAALADLIEAGALVRSPQAVQSCTRLTLGADWGQLSAADEARIGVTILARLYELHYWRKVEIDEILGRWSDKFIKDSTCATCDQDPWEIFLLTTVVGMIKEGTAYIDKETASDTSSEDSDGDGDDSKEVSNDERDDHQGGIFSDLGSDDDCSMVEDGHTDPRLLPLDDAEEPPRAPTDGLGLHQRLLRNYGPNEYILRIVSMDQFGGAKLNNPQFRVCPRCGFRFDGKDLIPGTRAHDMLERAVLVAREQIAALQEVINLPSW